MIPLDGSLEPSVKKKSAVDEDGFKTYGNIPQKSPEQNKVKSNKRETLYKKLKKADEEKTKRKLEKKLVGKLSSRGVRFRRSTTHVVKKHRYQLSGDLSGVNHCDCPPSDATASKHLPLREHRASTM